MDIEKSLQQLKETADSTFLRELTFTREMEQKVWERTKRKKRLPGIGWWGSMVVAAAVLLLVLPAIYSHSPLTPQGQGSGTKQKPVLFPGAVWQVPSLWKASPLQSATVNGLSFQYYGEKPVRIITSEMYEDQGQKVMWLLNGSFAEQVELIGINEKAEKVKLGTYEVARGIQDADGSFPSTITLPEPGIWKLQVVSDGKHFGSVFVEVKAGIMPANKELVEPLIRHYLETNDQFVPNVKEWDVTIDLLGVKSDTAEKKTAYAWVKILSKNPLSSAGINGPMAFEIKYDGNQYKVVSHQMTKDGNLYWSSIKDIFPAKYVEKIKRYSQP